MATRDQRVRADVMTALRIDHPDWSAEVHDGVVTVSGRVDVDEHGAAVALANEVPGVIAVEVH